MSRTRAVALSLSLAGLVLGITQYSLATIDPPAPADEPRPPALTLVKADWCRDVCNDECGGECDESVSVGCTCYWVCENGEDGSRICTSTIPMMVCGN